jgi:hypothetical protein
MCCKWIVLYIYMGGMFTKQPKNYQLPYLAQGKPTELVPVKSLTPFYQSHLMKE